jgi:hypothetical protein
MDVGGLGELCTCHGAFGMQGLVEAERIAHADHGDAGCAAEVGQHLAHKRTKLDFVHRADASCPLYFHGLSPVEEKESACSKH